MTNSIQFNKDYPKITTSEAIFKRAQKLIPCQTQMLAKGYQQHSKGVCPIYLERGKGSHVWDVDGNEYLDLTMGMGPMSLGYCYPQVDQAVKDQIEKGMNFTLIDPIEVEVAELIHELIPNAEKIRYSKAGADITSAAVRTARASTGRDQVICCGYHGWHDWYIGTTNRNRGIPKAVRELTTKIPYNDIEALKKALTPDTACFILEPVVFEEPKPGYLEEVQKLCKANGTLLIFDEIWTGFRIALGGAQEHYGIKPDLATYSKACANGLPIAILTGKADVMNVMEEDDFFFFTTFGGETLSLAATKATLLEMKEKDVPTKSAQKSAKLRDGFNAIAQQLDMTYVRSIGLDYRTMITISTDRGNPLELKTLLQQELIKRGVLWTGFHHISHSHTDEEIQYVLDAYQDALPVLKKAVDENTVKTMLVGEPVHPVFRNLGIGQH